MPRAWRSDAAGRGGPSWPTCDTLDDATLVVRAREGDITAFEALVRRYRVPVYRIAVRILTDPPSAADTAQEAFITAWRRLHDIKAEQAFAAWLYRITVTRALSAARARRPTASRRDGRGPGPVPRPRGPRAGRRPAGRAEMRPEPPDTRTAGLLDTAGNGGHVI